MLASQTLSNAELNVLAQITDTTFGRQSSPTGRCSIKTTLACNLLSINYICVVTMFSDKPQHDQLEMHKKEAYILINDYMKELRKNFKEGAGRALKAKEISRNDNIEIISTSPYTPRRDAYFRFNTVFEIS